MTIAQFGILEQHGTVRPGPTIHPSLQAWLAGSEQSRRLQHKKDPLFSLINSFSEIHMIILGKAPVNAMLVVFILKGRPSNQFI